MQQRGRQWLREKRCVDDARFGRDAAASQNPYMGAGEGRPPFKRPPTDALRKPLPWPLPSAAAPRKPLFKCGRTPQATSSSAAALAIYFT